MDLGTLRVGIGADLSAFNAGIASVQAQMKTVQAAAAPVAAAMAPIGQALQQSMESAQGAVEGTAAALKAVQAVAETSMGGARAAIDKTRDGLGRFVPAAKAAGDAIKEGIGKGAEEAADEAAEAAKRAGDALAKGVGQGARQAAEETRELRKMLRQEMGGRALSGTLERVGSGLQGLAGIGMQNGVRGETLAGGAMQAASQMATGFMAGGVAGLAIAGSGAAIDGLIGAYKELKKDQQDVIDAARDGYQAMTDKIRAQTEAVREATAQLRAYEASLKSGLSIGGEKRKEEMQGAENLRNAAQASVDRLTPILEGMNKRLGGLTKDSPMIPTDIANEGLIGQRDTLTALVSQQKLLAQSYGKTVEELKPLVAIEERQHGTAVDLTDLHTRIKKLVEQAQDSGAVGTFAAKLAEIGKVAGDLPKGLNPDEVKAFNEEVRELKRSMTEQRYQVYAHDLQRQGTTALHGAEDAGTSTAYGEAVAQLKVVAEQFRHSGATQAAKKAFKESSNDTIRSTQSQQFDKLAQELLKRAEPLKLLAERQGSAHVDQYLINLLQELRTQYAEQAKRLGIPESQQRSFNEQIASELRSAEAKLQSDVAASLQRELQKIADEVRRGDSSQIHNLYQSNAIGDSAQSANLGVNERRELTRAASGQSFEALSALGAKLGSELQGLQGSLSSLKLGGAVANGPPQTLADLKLGPAGGADTMRSLKAAKAALAQLRQQFDGLADLAGGFDKLPGGKEYKEQLDRLTQQIELGEAYQAAHQFSDDLKGAFEELIDAVKSADAGGIGGALGDIGKQALTHAGGATGDMANAVITGAKAGGPEGAAAAAAAQLLMQSNEFKFIINLVNKTIGVLAKELFRLLAFLAPVIDVIMQMVQVVAELVGMIEGVLKPVFMVLYAAMKGVAMIVIYIVSAIQFAWESAVNSVLEGLAWFVGKFSDSWAKDIRSMEYQNASWSEILNKNMAGLNSIDFNRDAEASQNFGDSLNAATNALNAFSGYRVEQAYYDNMGAYGSPTSLRPHATGGTVVGIANGLAVTAAPGEGLVSIGRNESIVNNDDLRGGSGGTGGHITYVTIEQVILEGVKDARTLWREMMAVAQEETVAQIGSAVPGGPRYAGGT